MIVQQREAKMISICKVCEMVDTYLCNGDNDMCTECGTLDPGFDFEDEDEQ